MATHSDVGMDMNYSEIVTAAAAAAAAGGAAAAAYTGEADPYADIISMYINNPNVATAVEEAAPFEFDLTAINKFIISLNEATASDYDMI